MDKKETLELVKEMFYQNKVPEWIFKECERLLNSGGVDSSKYDHNYGLPKVLLYVAFSNLAHRYHPMGEPYNSDAKNLMYF